MQIVKALFHDGYSWVLLLLLGVTVIVGLTTLFNRYDQVDRYKVLLNRLEYDINCLKKDMEQKQEWIARLQNDPTAWEQVARDKMNYLGPNEMLITFIPER